MNNKVSILKYIKDVPKDRKAFVSKNKTIFYRDIFDIFYKNFEIIKNLKDLSIVINTDNKEDFALLVSLLDSHVKRIVFIPQDIDKDLLIKYYKETSVNCEILLNKKLLEITHISDKNENLQEIQETQWILSTSGTTSTPKLVSHTFKSLNRTVKKNIEKGSNFVWALTFDIYRFSGIQVFLQSLLSGSTLVIPESNVNFKTSLNLFLENSCNIISATPSFYRKALMSQEFSLLNLKRITLGGEISDKTILEALKNKFADAKITHIYASTEVGVGFCVTDEESGFPLSFVTNGVNGTYMKIDTNNILYIKPKNKIQNYLYLKSMYDKNGFINTGDLVNIKKDRIYFQGRESGSINIGGNKVQPEEIEAILLESNLVKEVYVYPKKSPIIGSLVCADIVIDSQQKDKNTIKKNILNYCKQNLPKYKVPALLRIVETINLSQCSKLKRN